MFIIIHIYVCNVCIYALYIPMYIHVYVCTYVWYYILHIYIVSMQTTAVAVQATAGRNKDEKNLPAFLITFLVWFGYSHHIPSNDRSQSNRLSYCIQKGDSVL